MTKISPQIDPGWKEILQSQFESDYFMQLKAFLVEERKHHDVYPPGSKIFAAYDAVPFDKVKVVIIGQDPYHGPGQANGLCFSVCKGVKPPPSLRNIFKEIHQDLDIPIPGHGDLSAWAEQGVLLLNAVLTVRAHLAQSHQKKGWEHFTDYTIRQLSEKRQGLVFLLWGRAAQNKAALIDKNRHHILTSVHPSPLSASRGFFGCKHFSKTNAILTQMGKVPVDWAID